MTPGRLRSETCDGDRVWLGMRRSRSFFVSLRFFSFRLAVGVAAFCCCSAILPVSLSGRCAACIPVSGIAVDTRRDPPPDRSGGARWPVLRCPTPEPAGAHQPHAGPSPASRSIQPDQNIPTARQTARLHIAWPAPSPLFFHRVQTRRSTAATGGLS